MLEYYYIKGKYKDIAAFEKGGIDSIVPTCMKLLIIGESKDAIRIDIKKLSHVEIYSICPSI